MTFEKSEKPVYNRNIYIPRVPKIREDEEGSSSFIEAKEREGGEV